MKSERGFTLVETMVAVAITGVIVAIMGLSVQQMVTVPEQGNDHIDALHAVQNAAHWVSLDGEGAKSAIGGSSLNITLPDSSNVTYNLSGGSLHRTCDNVSRTVAEGITGVNFTVSGRIITMNIVAAPESRWDISENRTYQVYMRPTG
jgi:prepilin-type N-terminal cleavage/methylation domain-containing protein